MTKKLLLVLANTITTAVGYRNSNDVFSVRRLLPPLEPVLSFGTDALSLPPHATTTDAPLPVTYTNDPSMVHEWLRDNCRAGVALGFDVESVPDVPWLENKVRFEGPATVQLATTDDCLVVHLTRRFGSARCPSAAVLSEVLSDPSILKVGTGVDSDMLELFRFDNELRGRGRVDLGVGLKRSVNDALGLELPKKRKLSVSNWSRIPLADAQLDYCARDAWAGAAVFEALGGDVERIRGVLKREEMPIWEVCRRASIRKRAKIARKRLRGMYYRGKGTEFPIQVRRKLDILDRIVRDTKTDSINLFEEELIGLTP